MNGTDEAVWALVFVGVGIMVMVNAAGGRFVLIGGAGIMVGLGFFIKAWHSWMADR